MKIYPAIDISEGACIRLTRGVLEDKSVYKFSPLEMAMEYKKEGFENIHIVDIDATLARGNNFELIKDIRKKIDINIQVAGGIRDTKTIKDKINYGFNQIVIGTLAVKKTDFINDLLDDEQSKISIALDLKDGFIASHGWKEKNIVSLSDITKIYNNKNIHSYFITDVSKDGMLSGLNFDIFNSVKKLTSKKITVGGGVKNMEDIIKANKKGYDGIVVGKAIYEHNIKLRDLSKYQTQC